MIRRCSHCSNNGHNSRTCPTRGGGSGGGSGGGEGVKLFGVSLTNNSNYNHKNNLKNSFSMKKSASMGNLSHYYSNSSTASPNNNNSPSPDPLHGYASDDPNHASCSSNRRSDRKKGKPWTEEEHRQFLVGLQKLGKGDWRGIARNYVVSRTPTQVASHAQKYFIRQSHATRRKRRSSLFDMVPDMVTEEPESVPEEPLLPSQSQPRETDKGIFQPSLNLCLSTEAEPMEATTSEVKESDDHQPQALPNTTSSIPGFFLSFPYQPFWPQPIIHPEEDSKDERLHRFHQHQVLKPTPLLSKELVNVDELVGMSQLNIGEAEKGHTVQPLNLLGAPSRQSAFHASPPVSSSDRSEGPNSAIKAV